MATRKPIVIGQNENATIKVVDRFANEYNAEMVMHHELPDNRGQFMMSLIERFGVIAATKGPEDSNGRATLVLLPEIEVVERAAAITALTFNEMSRRGWLVEIDRPADTEGD